MTPQIEEAVKRLEDKRGTYVWFDGSGGLILDGTFDADDLRAILLLLENNQPRGAL